MEPFISAFVMGLAPAAHRGVGVVAWLVPAVWVAGASVIGTILALRWRGRGSGESPHDDGEDDGGSRRPRPTPSPPSGPVSWPDFERDFAEYCARQKRAAHRD